MRSVTLKDVVVDLQSGFASGEEDALGIVQTRMNNITSNGRLLWDRVRRVPRPKNLPKLLVSPGDILFNATNSPDLVGKSALFTGYEEPVTFSNHFLRIRLNQSVADPSFISRVLHDLWRKRTFAGLCKQWVNQATVSKDDLLGVELRLPPLGEQKRIATILDQADALRQKRGTSLVMLSGLPQAIFVEMFGSDQRPRGTFVRERLGNHLSFVTSGGRGWAEFYSQSGRRFLRSLDVQMNRIGNEGIVFVTPPKNAEALRTEVMVGDVLLTITGSRIGRVAAVPPELAGSFISQHVAILRPRYSILPGFLSFYLSLESGGQRQIAKAQYGQTKPGLNFDLIRDFQVPIPPIELQKRFVSQIERVEGLRATQVLHSFTLDSLFASLQHRAFRGELTVRDAKRELEMAS